MKVLFCGLGIGGGQRNLKDFLEVAGTEHDLTAVRGDKRRPLAADDQGGAGDGDVCAHYGIREIADMSVALKEKPDAAIISFPARRRVATVEACLAAGVAVYIEPPVGLTFESANKLESATPKGLVNMVGYPLRFDRGLAFIKEALRTNLIGQVLHASALHGEDHRTSKDDVVFGESQEIDCLNWIFGMPVSVAAIGAKGPGRDSGAEGLAAVTMRYKKGDQEFLVRVALNHFQDSGFRGMRVQGTSGNLAWDFNANKVEVRIEKGRTIRQFGKNSLDGLYKAQMKHFLECVGGRVAPLCSIADGVACLSVVDAIRTSMQEHREITLGG
jgi:predicted dehydrogenase